MAGVAQNGRLRAVLAVGAVVLAPCGGCAVRRAAPPAVPSRDSAPAALGGATLHLRSFAVEGLRERDGTLAVERLRERFVDYVEAHTDFAAVLAPSDGGGVPDAVVADVRITLRQTLTHSWVLGALGVVTGGLIAPWRGRVDATVETTIHVGGAPVSTYRQAADGPFGTVWCSWYRRGYVERAYRQVYAELFDGVAAALASDRDRVLAALGRARSDSPLAEAAPRPGGLLALREEELPPLPEPSGALPLPSLPWPEPSDAASVDATELPMPSDTAPRLAPLAPSRAGGPSVVPAPRKDFGIVRERPRAAVDGPLLAALQALGGVEVSGIYGFARVASSVEDDAGQPLEVAAGEARQWGWGIALYGAPRTTGFYVTPVAGFLSQQIEIADFRQTLPEASVPGGTNIPAVCSRPSTHERFDCGSPNTYALAMRSGYGGVRGGYDLVAGNASIVLSASANAGVNVAEYRSIEARIGSYRGERSEWDFLASGAAGASLGLELPRLHTALRLAAEYEHYRAFTYPRPLQFEGEVVYDPVDREYAPAVRYVSGASLTAWTLQCMLALTF